jgi:hypothetical protein
VSPKTPVYAKSRTLESARPASSQSIKSRSDDDSLFESASETDWEDRGQEPGAAFDAGALLACLEPDAGTAFPDSSADHKPLGGSGVVTIEKESVSLFSRMGGMLGMSNSLPASSHGDECSGRVLSRIEGSWLSNLDFDGRRYDASYAC